MGRKTEKEGKRQRERNIKMETAKKVKKNGKKVAKEEK